jgi:catechol 2,3-dioxygenase-like lactoylglutathione lyase family enzyme
VTGFGAVHHVGITVADMDRAVDFWTRLVGYPGIHIESCWVDLPGGVALELLRYLDRDDAPYDPGTAHPGNVHVCLDVEDMETAHAHAVACGATPVSEQPIEVAAGPRAGTRLAYLRDPDGVTIELVQRPHA